MAEQDARDCELLRVELDVRSDGRGGRPLAVPLPDVLHPADRPEGRPRAFRGW